MWFGVYYICFVVVWDDCVGMCGDGGECARRARGIAGCEARRGTRERGRRGGVRI